MSSLLEAHNLFRHYGDTCAVADVSIHLEPGDILGLLGPNGAGKTTTMGMLTGNLAPSAGRILIKGTDLLNQPRAAKRNIGYLPEQPPVHKDLSVNEYLRFCAQLKGMKKSGLKAAVDRAKQRTGLADTGHRMIGNLSKGYQQRVGIAQAIIHEPDVIILDEPTVGLDPIQILEIRRLIQELGKSHGVILSTHILPEVQTVCNRIHIMHRGQIAYDDAAQNHAHTGQISLQLGSAGNTDAIKAISDIDQVDALPDNRYRIYCDDSKAVAPKLAELAVAQGWPVIELVPETLGLEQIFISLTQGEQAIHSQADVVNEEATA